MIDIVIPTMWRADNIISNLEQYLETPAVNKVILIDNNRSQRPTHEVFKHPKLELVDYGRNIYVNPAWNEGYKRSTQPIVAFINDDITVYPELLMGIANTDFTDIDIIGVNLRSGKDNYTIGEYTGPDKLVRLDYDKTKPIGGQAWAFGICMFIKRESYHEIPSLYQIWYGDDYLTQHVENVYILMTNKIKGVISKTLTSYHKNKEIEKRIELDSTNAYNYDHFVNGKNWDIFKHKMTQTNLETKPYSLLEEEYQRAKATPSDINENLYVLYDLAKECTHVTEMGVRTGVSTRAFLNTDAELVSYDLELNPQVEKLFEYAKSIGKKAKYIKANVLAIEIEPTDMIFIDTYHVYEHLKQELKLHANKARKYLAFHDTYAFGQMGENGIDYNGLMTAVIEFVIENPEWKFKFHTPRNNGMTVLERK